MPDPSGNRHDGVELSKLVDYTPTPVDVYRPSGNCGYVPTHVARPVDIDAARTAVIESLRHVKQARGVDAFNERWRDLLVDLANLDALTTKGATNA